MDYKKAKIDDVTSVNDKLREANDRAEEFYKKEQLFWKDELTPLYNVLKTKNITDIADLQANVLSTRHRIQESLSKYVNRLSKEYSKYKKIEGDRLEFYLINYGIKISSNTEKAKLIDRDMNEYKHSIELLECHIDNLKECRYACDQIGYSIKNMTALLDYLI